VFIALLTGLINTAAAQPLKFYFVAPQNVITSNFHVPLDSTWCPARYARVEITAANAALFNTIAPRYIKHVYTQLQPGTALRANINKVFQNSQGVIRRVEYWLTDDQTSFTTSTANPGGWFIAYPANNPKYVWPGAGNYIEAGNNHVGIVGLGEHQLATDQSQRTGGMSAVDEVVLHESSHTQFLAASKWEGVGGNAITYGADGQHYSRGELLGDQEGALNEGLATFYGFIMNDNALQELINYYTRADYRYFVEGRSFLAGQRDLFSIATRRRGPLVHIVDGREVIQRYANGDEITIFSYRWRDVPGFYLLFNESISTLFFSFFRNQTYQNKDTAFSMIQYAARAMSQDRRKRFLTYACNRIALKMEEYNRSPAGVADASKGVEPLSLCGARPS
jgi:hypothetical protein